MPTWKEILFLFISYYKIITLEEDTKNYLWKCFIITYPDMYSPYKVVYSPYKSQRSGHFSTKTCTAEPGSP